MDTSNQDDLISIPQALIVEQKNGLIPTIFCDFYMCTMAYLKPPYVCVCMYTISKYM